MESKGDTLKRLRRGMGARQKDLALMSGVSLTTISEIECGKATPYRRTLLRLAYALDAFGCKGAADLIDGTGAPVRGEKISAFIRLTLHIAPTDQGTRGGWCRPYHAPAVPHR